MNRRASPFIYVPALSKAAVAAAETDPPVAATFVSLRTSTVTRGSGGTWQPTNAVFPDQHDYQKLRFEFGPLTVGNADNDATIELYGLTAEQKVIHFGQIVVTNGAYVGGNDIEIDNNYEMKFAVVLSTVAGTTPAITFDVSVQGIHVPTFVSLN